MGGPADDQPVVCSEEPDVITDISGAGGVTERQRGGNPPELSQEGRTQVRARLVIGAYGSILTNFVKVLCASGVRG
jgi:hypothetical protein